jgi:hypothetical protein
VANYPPAHYFLAEAGAIEGKRIKNANIKIYNEKVK